MNIGDKMYRYDGYRTWDYEKIEDGHLVPAIGIGGTEFCVEKITPCGCWIMRCDNGTNRRHFILNNARKKFAYETKALAMKAFIARKRRQIEILTDRLATAKKLLLFAVDIEEKEL